MSANSGQRGQGERRGRGKAHRGGSNASTSHTVYRRKDQPSEGSDSHSHHHGGASSSSKAHQASHTGSKQAHRRGRGSSSPPRAQASPIAFKPGAAFPCSTHAGVIILNPACTHMLVVKTYKSWSNVAGGRQEGDVDAKATALRELSEEVGWHLPSSSPLFVCQGEAYRENGNGSARANEDEPSPWSCVCVRFSDQSAYSNWYNLVRLENLEHAGTVVTEEVRAILWVPVQTMISRNFIERYENQSAALRYFLKRLSNPASSDSKDIVEDSGDNEDDQQGDDDAKVENSFSKLSLAEPAKHGENGELVEKLEAPTQKLNLYTLYIATVTVKGRPSLFYIRRDMGDIDAAMTGGNWPQYWEVPMLVVEGTLEASLAKLGLAQYEVLFVDESEKIIAIASDHEKSLSKWNPPLHLLRSARGSSSQELIGFGLFFPFAKWILDTPGIPDEWERFQLRKAESPFYKAPSQQHKFAQMMILAFEEWMAQKDNLWKTIFEKVQPSACDAGQLFSIPTVAEMLLMSFLERMSPLKFVHQRLLEVGNKGKIHPATQAIIEMARAGTWKDLPPTAVSHPQHDSHAPI